MKKETKYRISFTIIVMLIHTGMILMTRNIVQPYVMKHLGLNYKESSYIIVFCYFSWIYGMVSMVLMDFFGEKLRKHKKIIDK